jgi:hypothetical protein
MRVKAASDIFQEVMTKLFSDLDFVFVYLDAILILSNGSLVEDHMYKARCFLCMVHYHSDLRRRCSHLLKSPLSVMVSESPN